MLTFFYIKNQDLNALINSIKVVPSLRQRLNSMKLTQNEHEGRALKAQESARATRESANLERAPNTNWIYKIKK